MGIILGLASALCFGTADFLARYAVQRVGVYRSLLYMQFVGLVGVGIYLLASGSLQSKIAGTSWQPWAWAVGVSAFETLCALALYRSFEIGVLSIVSPVTASFAAVTVVLSVLSGEALSGNRIAGIGAALVGVVLASYAATPDQASLGSVHTGRLPRGVPWALAAAAGFGVGFWLLGFQIIPQLGGVIPVGIVRVVTPLMLLLAARPLGQNVAIPTGGAWRLLGAVGVLDTAGFLAVAIGLGSDQVAVVSVITSLFSAITVLLAWLFLREQLHRSQWAGVAFILVGVGLVSA